MYIFATMSFNSVVYMKKMFCAAFVFLFALCSLPAQVDARYLAGAVPEENGRVVFSETFELPGFARSEVYRRALEWANLNYRQEGETNKVVYASEEQAVVSCRGAEELVFQSTALALDKATMRYQLNIHCDSASCKLELRSISYIYNVSYKDTPEVYKAEEWITDKEAVNKNKLYRSSGKFRIKTIDLTDDIFDSFAIAMESGNANDFHVKEVVVPKSRSSIRAGVATGQ